MGIRPTPPVPPDPQEEDWIRRARLGDQDAMARLVERYSRKVFNLAYRMLADDRETAADITQEVFLRVHRGLPGFAGDCRFSTWIHQIAANVCISEMRKRRALKRGRRTVSLDAPIGGGQDDLRLDPPSPSRDPAEVVADHEMAQKIRVAMDDLPEDMKLAVTLRDIRGLSYEEIAEIVGTPIGTVRSRLHRAREHLRLRLEGET